MTTMTTTKTSRKLTISDAGQRVTIAYDGGSTVEAVHASLAESDDWSSDRVPWVLTDADGGEVLRGAFRPAGGGDR